MVGLKMNVVATMKRFFSMGGNIGTHMILIRRLIGRETSISIKTVSGIFHRNMSNRRVELGNTKNSLCRTFLEICFHGQILILVFLKPRTIIVCAHIAQELQDSFCIHYQNYEL